MTDGAEWLQGCVDLHRPDAVRLLDVPHAAEHLKSLVEAFRQAGGSLPADGLERSVHELKHRGPQWLLRMLEKLPSQLRERETVREQLRHFLKCETLMPSPQYRRQGWPIGDSMKEQACIRHPPRESFARLAHLSQ